MIILLVIGALSGAWLLSGIVPAMIYYGLKILNPTIFLFAACNNSEQPKNKTFSPEEMTAETKKANIFFNKVFDEAVDRDPNRQSYLGIKKELNR